MAQTKIPKSLLLKGKKKNIPFPGSIFRAKAKPVDVDPPWHVGTQGAHAAPPRKARFRRLIQEGKNRSTSQRVVLYSVFFFRFFQFFVSFVFVFDLFFGGDCL